MADGQTTNNGDAPPPPPEKGFLPVHIIPEDILQEWSALPAETPITVAITKQDLDNLFFAVANTHNAIDMTNRSFVQWSNSQFVEAQGNLEGSRHSLVAGMNCLRYFFQAIVTNMVRGSRNG